MWIKYKEDDTFGLINTSQCTNIELTQDEMTVFFYGTHSDDAENMVNVLEFKDAASAKAAFEKIVSGIENGDKLLILNDKFSTGELPQPGGSHFPGYQGYN